MDDFEKFYKASIRFLSFRPRSEKELTDYLTKKTSFATSYAKASKVKKASEGQEKLRLQLLINSIIESLKKDKFINDEEFVKWWIEQRTLIKPKAWRIIKSELKMKGISREAIEEIQESDFKNENDKNSALKLAEKKLRTIHDQSNKFKTREKLSRYLAGKGFDWDIVKEAIDRVLEK
jgi:regulatory protein